MSSCVCAFNYLIIEMVKKKIIAIIINLIFINASENIAQLQQVSTIKINDRLIISNNSITRSFVKYCNGCMLTDEIILQGDVFNFLNGTTDEFCFEINDSLITGYNKWNIEDINDITDSYKGNGIVISLKGAEKLNECLKLEMTYLLYPELPVIRKKLKITNTGKTDVKIESLEIESLGLSWDKVESNIYKDYARKEIKGSYEGNWDDPLIIIHNPQLRRGIALGNEAPSVMKCTDIFLEGNHVGIGLTHKKNDYPFRKWLKSGESWESPFVFICLYKDSDDPMWVINNPVNDFVRRNLGSRLSNIEELPVFVYNTWRPFQDRINDSLIYAVATSAAACGFEEFIIDAGWYSTLGDNVEELNWADRCGDWIIDSTKFPEGLKPVFDSIVNLGMKPGLWISLASAHPGSKVYRCHPEWFIKNKYGDPTNLHNPGHEIYTACMGTDWYEYIKSVILFYIRECGLKYVKLDLSIVTSAYIRDVELSGCYANDHPYHKDHHESLYVLFDRCMTLFDELHKEDPELLIDCTFETAGKPQLNDYAIIKHAEVGWLSNIEDSPPFSNLLIRKYAWKRTPVIPASSLVIGNPSVNDPDYQLTIKTISGSFPMLLGDPTVLTDEEKLDIKGWADWLRNMQNKYNFMMFRQDLPGFNEPSDGYWDGWARINTETGEGGIIGIFRHGSDENEMNITINGLEERKKYGIKKAREDKILYQMTGKQLLLNGFKVELNKLYDGELFEIESIDF